MGDDSTQLYVVTWKSVVSRRKTSHPRRVCTCTSQRLLKLPINATRQSDGDGDGAGACVGVVTSPVTQLDTRRQHLL